MVEERERFLGKRVNYPSDEISGKEAAEILPRVTGRDIQYFQIPIEQVRENSEEFARMYEWFERRGYSADIKALRRGSPQGGLAHLRGMSGGSGLERLGEPLERRPIVKKHPDEVEYTRSLAQ